MNQSRGAVRGFLLSPPSGFVGSDAGGSDPWKRPKCSGVSAGSRPKRSYAETLSRAKAVRDTAPLEQRAELNPAWHVHPQRGLALPIQCRRQRNIVSSRCSWQQCVPVGIVALADRAWSVVTGSQTGLKLMHRLGQLASCQERTTFPKMCRPSSLDRQQTRRFFRPSEEL